MKWIKISDKIPEKNHKVMVYYGDGSMNVNSHGSGKFDEYFDDKIIWDDNTIGVTHWSELPNPPMTGDGFLELLDEIISEREDKAILFICNSFSDLMYHDQGELIDEIISLVDVEEYSEAILVSFLAFTLNYCPSDSLAQVDLVENDNRWENRQNLYLRILEKMKRDFPDNFEAIMNGPECQK